MPFSTDYQFVNLDDDDTLPITNPLIDLGGTGGVDIIGLANGGLASAANTSASTYIGKFFDTSGGALGTFGTSLTEVSLAQLGNGNVVYVGVGTNFVGIAIADSTGNPVLPVTAISTAGATAADVTALAGGGFAVTYQQNFATESDVFLTILDNAGNVASSFAIDNSNAKDTAPSIAQLDGGNLVVAWTRTVGAQTEIWYAIKAADGSAVKAPALFDTTGTVNKEVSVTALDGGGFAFAYTDNEFVAGNVDLALATFDAAGNAILKSNVGDSFPNSDAALIRLDNGLLAMSYTQAQGKDHDSFVALIDPTTGNILAQRDIITTDISNDSVRAVLAEFGAGQIVVADNDVNDGKTVGEVLLIQRTSTGDQISNNNFTGDNFIDIVTGGDLIDKLNGGGGNDRLAGLNGVDTLNGDAGDDILEGGFGSDTLNGGAGNDMLFGATLDDPGSSGVADFIHGGEGNDQIFGSNGSSQLDGDGGDDAINGGEQADQINGGAGKDTVNAGGGNDTLTIDGQNVLLDEVFNGGDDFDVLRVARAGGTLLQNATITNFEQIQFSDTVSGVMRVQITAAQAGGTMSEIDGRSGADVDQLQIAMDTALNLNLSGLSFTDWATTDRVIVPGDGDAETIIGSSQRDEIAGSGGDDALNGRQGNDKLSGGAGSDVLTGAAGIDTMTGGSAKDRFDFNLTSDSSAGATRDVITDFTIIAANSTAFFDRIDLSDIDASVTAAGVQDFTFIGTAAFTAEGQVRVVQVGGDTVVQVNTKTGAGAEMHILLTGVTAADVQDVDFLL